MGFWNKKYKEPELISLHIPKTAGTSFRNILKSVYGSGNVARFDMMPKTGIRLNEAPYDADKLPEIQVIHGHFNFKALGETYTLPENYKSITWLRDPVERVVSNFFYLEERLVEIVDESKRHVNILGKMQRTLIEYARDKGNRNRQFKFLRGVELSDFDIVGIQEFYAEDVEAIARVLQWSKIPNVVHHNKTGKKPREIPEEWLEEIRALNDKDIALYEQALEMRQMRLKNGN